MLPWKICCWYSICFFSKHSSSHKTQVLQIIPVETVRGMLLNINGSSHVLGGGSFQDKRAVVLSNIQSNTWMLGSINLMTKISHSSAQLTFRQCSSCCESLLGNFFLLRHLKHNMTHAFIHSPLYLRSGNNSEGDTSIKAYSVVPYIQGATEPIKRVSSQLGPHTNSAHL